MVVVGLHFKTAYIKTLVTAPPTAEFEFKIFWSTHTNTPYTKVSLEIVPVEPWCQSTNSPYHSLVERI